MPLSVLETMDVDYCVPLSRIGKTINTITKSTEPREAVVHDDVVKEAEISENTVTNIQTVAQLGEKSLFACPDCGGGLWSVENSNIKRYRCHIGHSYTQSDLLIKQSETIESTLWVALRMIEERKMLLLKMSDDEKNKGLARLARTHEERAEDLEQHIKKLKEILFASQKD